MIKKINSPTIKRCCVCNKKATKQHFSIFGSIPFNVCDYHYKNTSPAAGYCNVFNGNRIGLINKKYEWVDLAYYSSP